MNIEAEQMSLNYRIAVIVPYPTLDTIPSLCAAIELLAERGYYIDIFIRESKDFEFPAFNSDRIHVFSSRIAEDRVSQFTRLQCLSPIKVLLQPFKRMLKKMLDESLLPQMKIIHHRHREIPYKTIIGIDPEGLEAAGHIAELLGVPLVYWSFELFFSSELSDKYYVVLKEREIALSRKAVLIVIQDEERAKLMVTENNVSLNKFLFIPNSPVGPIQQKSAGYWHKLFGLREDQRIVLHAGSFEEWTGIGEIISSVNNWPEDWVLIVHSRYHNGNNRKFKELHTDADSCRVFFSTRPVPRTRYTELVAGADIGIAFYLPMQAPFTQENIHTIGLSSGKISYYLKVGLPVIVNKWPSISKFIQNEGCGIAVNTAGEIGEAIRIITKSYDDYHINAYKVFEKYLEPSHSLRQFTMHIDNL